MDLLNLQIFFFSNIYILNDCIRIFLFLILRMEEFDTSLMYIILMDTYIYIYIYNIDGNETARNKAVLGMEELLIENETEIRI